MDRARGVRNVGVALASKALAFVAALVVRRLLVQHMGSEANGLISLYASILGVLSVAELGVGGAITFCMYGSVVAGDTQGVAALHRLYRRLYLAIGAVVLVAGLAALPLLPALTGGVGGALGPEVSGAYLLALASSVIVYAYGAEASLIDAHKDNWLTSAIATCSALVRCALQVAAILALGSLAAFVACQVAESLLACALTWAAARRRHGGVLRARGDLDARARAGVARSVRAMIMHKVGTVLVNSVDGLVISAFAGVAALGRYANYALVAGALAGAASLVFSPLSSVVGHLCAEGSPTEAEAEFDRLWCLNLVLAFVLFLGYYAVADAVVELWLGPGQGVARAVVFAVALSQFVQCMRVATLLFRDATGTFYNDRWKPVAEGVANLALSVSLAAVLPPGLRVAGVMLATVATSLVVCHVVEPYVVFRHAFGAPVGAFYRRSYGCMALFATCLVVEGLLCVPRGDALAGIVANGFISLAVSAAALVLVAVVDGVFRASACAMAVEAIGWIRERLCRWLRPRIGRTMTRK